MSNVWCIWHSENATSFGIFYKGCVEHIAHLKEVLVLLQNEVNILKLPFSLSQRYQFFFENLIRPHGLENAFHRTDTVKELKKPYILR